MSENRINRSTISARPLVLFQWSAKAELCRSFAIPWIESKRSALSQCASLEPLSALNAPDDDLQRRSLLLAG